ncbi:MAG TPA: hypothetical protein VEW95_02510 [Candidatus Limnocylindrales bacterium]|nr:hypothetical protein [Candidatus Limnocylindrales bacterium]
MAGPVRADGGLTDAVASAYFPRTVDDGLHAIAHQRVTEISACECLAHDGRRAGTAEVLAWNVRIANPVGHVVSQWINSPGHDAILSDRSLGRIGCAEGIVAEVHWFACVLASGPLPAQAEAMQPVMVLPDTALLDGAMQLAGPGDARGRWVRR